jgi:lipoprotein-anchoring transpeptidase ErfK/SrfK
MTDYEPLLRKAIGGLDRPDGRARDDVYERARQALIRQMRGAGASDDEIDRQLEDIGAAIARIEDEIARDMPRPGQPPRRAPPPSGPTSPEAAAVLRRGPTALMVVGVLTAILVAGFGAYYFSIRERPRPSPAVRTETLPQPVARAETPTPPAATTSQPQSSNPEITLVDDEQASYVLRRQRIFYRTTHPPGTIIVSRSQRFLYLVQPNQSAIRYAIGTGPECENVTGLFRITEKVSLPGSSPAGAPAAAPLPKFVLSEQFGPRALYFDGAHAVHGTAAPHQIGQSAPAGCFLSWKPDILDLYDRVQLNDRVVVGN